MNNDEQYQRNPGADKPAVTLPFTNNVSNDNDGADGSGFAVAPDDPRSVQQRGGLESVIERTTEKLGYEPSAQDLGPADDGIIGTTGPDPDYAGSNLPGSATTTTGSGITNLNTTGMFGSSAVAAGVGPTESVIGTQAPQVEVTDVGLVDVGSTDISVTGDDDNVAGGGARVEDENGQPL